MAKDLGFLTGEQEKWLIKFLIALFNFKGLKKWAAKLILPTVVSYLDDQIVENKVSAETQEIIENIIAYGIAGDNEGLTTYINEKIDLPELDEEDENDIISPIVKIGLKYIKKNVDKIELSDE